MDAKNLRRLLHEPYLLNLICALLALERVYDSFDKVHETKLVLQGHVFPIGLYLSGFLVGWFGSALISKRWRKNANCVSYIFLFLASVILIWMVYEDTATLCDTHEICCFF